MENFASPQGKHHRRKHWAIKNIYIPLFGYSKCNTEHSAEYGVTDSLSLSLSLSPWCGGSIQSNSRMNNKTAIFCSSSNTQQNRQNILAEGHDTSHEKRLNLVTK